MADHPLAARERHDPATQPVNVLLVDDQPGRLLTYRAILEPLGERLLEASSGQEALRVLMQEDCAVILLDVNMPGMDGFETASLIHQHPRYERTPIIFVSAVNVSDMDRLRGYKLGAVDYVFVPVVPEMIARISAIASRTSLRIVFWSSRCRLVSRRALTSSCRSRAIRARSLAMPLT